MRNALAFVALVLAAAAVAEPAKIETTMTVARCRHVLKNGKQCPYQAEVGKTRCWRHRGAAQAVNDTLDDAGKGASETWKSTKDWSTNAWESTKRNTNKAWQATQEAFEEAGEEMAKIFSKPKKSKKKDAKK